jgi:hypothetical protein
MRVLSCHRHGIAPLQADVRYLRTSAVEEAAEDWDVYRLATHVLDREREKLDRTLEFDTASCA